MANLRELPVLIMCGGKGSRFSASNTTTQKCSAPIGSTSIIVEIVKNLKNQGFSNPTFIAGAYSEQLKVEMKKHFNELNDKDFILNEDVKGTGLAIHRILDEIPDKFLYHHGNMLLPSTAYPLLVDTFNRKALDGCHFFIAGEDELTHPRVQIQDGLINQVFDKASPDYSLNLPPLAGVGVVNKRTIVPLAQPNDAFECILDLTSYKIGALSLNLPWEHIETEADRKKLEQKWL